MELATARASIGFEDHLQAVVFAANLIVGHLVPSVVLNILERPALNEDPPGDGQEYRRGAQPCSPEE